MREYVFQSHADGCGASWIGLDPTKLRTAFQLVKLSDGQGKSLLRKWPARPAALWNLPYGTPKWFRASPTTRRLKARCPTLSPPRAEELVTNPDGMWVNLGQRGLADVFCVEVCGTLQNFNDKRSRFLVIASSLVVTIEKEWLLEEIPTPGGGRKARHAILGRRAPRTTWYLPVRHLRVLFVLTKADYAKFGRNGVAAGHEYFCAHSSLGSFTSQKMQKFLRRMAPGQHFLTKPKGNRS